MFVWRVREKLNGGRRERRRKILFEKKKHIKYQKKVEQRFLHRKKMQQKFGQDVQQV